MSWLDPRSQGTWCLSHRGPSRDRAFERQPPIPVGSVGVALITKSGIYKLIRVLMTWGSKSGFDRRQIRSEAKTK